MHTDLQGGQCQLGYVPQAPAFVEDSLRRSIAMDVTGEDIEQDRIVASLQTAQVEEWVPTLDGSPNIIIGIEASATLVSSGRGRS